MTSSAAIGAYTGCAGTLHALAGAGAHDAFGGNEGEMQYLLVFHRERVASLLALLEGLEGQWGGVTIRGRMMALRETSSTVLLITHADMSVALCTHASVLCGIKSIFQIFSQTPTKHFFVLNRHQAVSKKHIKTGAMGDRGTGEGPKGGGVQTHTSPTHGRPPNLSRSFSKLLDSGPAIAAA